jgi:putative Mg2+ transporter-C (MgtC) family protein
LPEEDAEILALLKQATELESKKIKIGKSDTRPIRIEESSTPMPITDFLIRLFTALILGAFVGLERQWRQRMAGTRTNALVAAGACAFVMCAFLVRDTSRSETQIVSYVVSGVGFLGAGVIFKDGGTVRGLNTAATIWCSAAMGAICGLGQLLYGACVGAAVLLANIILRPLAYRLYPSQQAGQEQEVIYVCELVCRPEDEAHLRALLLQEIAQTTLTLTALKSEDIEGTMRMKVGALIRGLGRQDQALERLVTRLSLEGGVSSISWTVTAQALE